MLKKVLLLDTDNNVLASYSRQLKNAFDIIAADSGEKGLEIFRANKDIAAVVSELNLSKIKGLSFFEKSKDLFPNSIRRVLTGYLDQKSIIEVDNSAGVSGLLFKPCSIDSIKNSIEDGLKNGKSNR